MEKHHVCIASLAAAYPEPTVTEDFLDAVLPELTKGAEKQVLKLRKINQRTGIKSRPVILPQSHPFYHQAEPLKVEELTALWLEHGLPLAEKTCTSALSEWAGSKEEITHLVAATCSIQSHPGIDAHLQHRLRLRPDIRRTLLSGVGCAGAGALLQMAFELAAASTLKGEAARILLAACDVNSLGFRAELEKLKEGGFPIGLTLFSDGAGAAVITNEIGIKENERKKMPFEILHSVSYTVPDSLDKLQLMPSAIGTVSTISDQLPRIVSEAVRELFSRTIASIPPLVDSTGKVYSSPADFEWDIHPGGLGIFDTIIEAMGLTRDNTTATVSTYESYGNSAGPTLFKVLDTRRNLPVKREFIVSCGFGNNVDVRMLIMKRAI